MSEKPVTLEQEGEATIVRMDDGKVNALSLSFLDVLAEQVEAAVDTGRPVVLTGNEKAFSAGLDLEEVPTLDEEGLHTLFARFEAVLEPILTAPVPVVAAVDGFAIAGGAIIALACDHRVGGPDAEIGATELRVGIPFPPQDLALFTERLPPQAIRRTVLDPRRTQGTEALELGWFDEIDQDAVSAAVAAAGRLGGPNPAAFRDVKQHLNAGVLEGWERFEDEHMDDYVELLTSKGTRQAILEGIADVMG